MQYINYYSSPLGKITLASNGKELTGLWFNGQKYFASTLTKEYEQKNLPVFEQTAKWLDIYFRAKIPILCRLCFYRQLRFVMKFGKYF